MWPRKQAEPAASDTCVPHILAQKPTHGSLDRFVIQTAFLQRMLWLGSAPFQTSIKLQQELWQSWPSILHRLLLCNFSIQSAA